MIEAMAANRVPQWKRPVIGGLLSTTPAIILSIVGVIAELVDSEFGNLLVGFWTLLAIGFGSPMVLLDEVTENIYLYMLFDVLVWFMIGAVIARCIKNNMVAVLCWLVAVAISAYIAITGYFFFV